MNSGRFVFVDRENVLNLMNSLLETCNDGHLVHIHGIPGIGKSHLLEHWNRSITDSIFIDCSECSNLLKKLEAIWSGLRRLGLRMPRFTTLWNIRLKFIEGVEPALGDDLSWQFKILKMVPFISYALTFAEGISVIGTKIESYLDVNHGAVAAYLRSQLGPKYGTEMLTVFWKDPGRAQQILLQALHEDLSKRRVAKQHHILIMLDRFEKVDDTQLKWDFEGQRVSEADLLLLLLSTLPCCIGVTASRKPVRNRISLGPRLTHLELREFDAESSLHLCRALGILNPDVASRVAEISHGHPDIMGTISDSIISLKTLDIQHLDELRGESMKEVRLRIWERLFGNTQIDLCLKYAAILPFFTKEVLESAIGSGINEVDFRKLTEISMIRKSTRHTPDGKDSESWELHELGRELAIGILASETPRLGYEAYQRLSGSHQDFQKPMLAGLAFSALALRSEQDAILEIGAALARLNSQHRYHDTVTMLECVQLASVYGRTWVLLQVGDAYSSADSIGSAETAYQQSVMGFERLVSKRPTIYSRGLAAVLINLANLLSKVSRLAEATKLYLRAIELLRGHPDDTLEFKSDLASALHDLGEAYRRSDELKEAEESFDAALVLRRELDSAAPQVYATHLANTLTGVGIVYWQTKRFDEAERVYKESLERFSVHAENPSEQDLILMAMTLTDLGALYGDLRKLESAESAFVKSLEIRRSLAEKFPGLHQDEVASALTNLGELYRLMNKPKDAENAFGEAIDIRRRLSASLPELYEPNLANTISMAALVHASQGQFEQAEKELTESLVVFRRFADNAPETYNPLVARTYLNLGVVLWDAHQPSDALSSLEESVTFYRNLYSKNPGAYHEALVKALQLLAIVYVSLGKPDEAMALTSNILSMTKGMSSRLPEGVPADMTEVFRSRLEKVLEKEGRLDIQDLTPAVADAIRDMKSRGMDLNGFLAYVSKVMTNVLGISEGESKKLLDHLISEMAEQE